MRWRSVSPWLRGVPGPWLTCVMLCAGVSFLVGCDRSVRVPALRGRVVDARTGEPIAGAVFRTRNYRTGAANLEAPRLIGGSTRESTAGEDGRFALPGFVGKEITGIGWLVYAPGYMVGSGCYGEEGWPPGGCSGFGLTRATDPWVRTSWQRVPDGVEVTLRLFPPTLEGVTFYQWIPERREAEAIPEDQLGKRYPNGLPDPWEEHVRRLDSLAGSLMSVAEVGVELDRLLRGGGELSEATCRLLLQIVDRNYFPEGQLREPDARAIVVAVRERCLQGCTPRLMAFLDLVEMEVQERSAGRVR